MTFDEFSRAVRNIIRLQLGYPEHDVRPANTNAPSGVGNFATVLISPFSNYGPGCVTYKNLPDNFVEETVHGLTYYNCSVQIFRSGAYAQLLALRYKLQTSPAIQLFNGHNIGISSIGQPINVSQIQGTLWEEQAQMNIQIHAVTGVAVSLETFGEFPMSVKTEQQTSEFLINEP